jgi:hypothetical protein
MTILARIEHRDRPKSSRTPKCRKLVKGVKSSNFFQAADSDGNINLKIWRVYPLEFATLEVEGKKQARPEIRLAPFLLE